MVIQSCYEPKELKILRCLDPRMHLSAKEKLYLDNLEKGYEGELIFEKEWLEPLLGECFILNDCLFEVNNTYFQIDTLLILQKMIYLFDVKNYEGDF